MSQISADADPDLARFVAEEVRANPGWRYPQAVVSGSAKWRAWKGERRAEFSSAVKTRWMLAAARDRYGVATDFAHLHVEELADLLALKPEDHPRFEEWCVNRGVNLEA